MTQSMLNKIKWLIYAVLLLVLYVLQTTPLLFQVLGIKPVLIVPFVVCLSLFESEKAAAAYGMLGGLLWDISANKLFGFRAIILMCCCIAVALLVMYLMRNNLLNALFLVTMVMIVVQLLDFVFFYALWGYHNSGLILLNYSLPTVAYTAVITVPVYYLTKAVARRCNDTLRM